MSLLRLPEPAYARLMVFKKKGPGKQGENRSLRRPGRESEESARRGETWGVYGIVLFGYSILLTTMSPPFFQ